MDLNEFKEQLRRDLPIDQTERLETRLKVELRSVLQSPLSRAKAREIALFQKELGFILKYKSYAIKAAAPVGYSVFLQNEREGFSFQRHVEHKLEVFHILQVKPGGYIFLCESDQWTRIYNKDTFQKWLAGGDNPDYDKYKFVPEPGDVFVISELGTVHTVIGCVLEEYATVSTDMVERLHDQNMGKPIPPWFNRIRAEQALRAIEMPRSNRVITGLEQRVIAPISPEPISGGERTILCDSFVRAALYVISPKQKTNLQREDDRVVLLRISHGEASLTISDTAPIEVSTSDLLLIPPGMPYAITNPSDDYLTYSEHCISPAVAFV